MPAGRRWGAWAVLAVPLLLMAGIAPGTARAQDVVPETARTTVPRPVIGIIDLQHIISESHAARQVIAQRDRYLETYQAEAATVEKELRAIDQELGRVRGSVPESEFADRQQAFQARVADFQKEVQNRRRALEQVFGDAMNEVQGAVIRAADMAATERGMNLILYRSQVFLFDSTMDLTDIVLERVNQALPTVPMADPDTVPVPEDAPPGGSIFGRPR